MFVCHTHLSVCLRPPPPSPSVRVEYQAAKDRKAEGTPKAAPPQPQQRTPRSGPKPPPVPPAAPPPPPHESDFPNHYATLGVPEFTATSGEIKKAYHKLALKYHPDKVATRAE